MEVERRDRTRWRCLKNRLSFFGCCGTIDLSRQPTYTITNVAADPTPDHQSATDLGCLLGLTPAAEEMNLATALAAEREYRGETGELTEPAEESPGTPLRVSLMRLLVEGEEGEEGGAGAAANWCCVCMGRRRGAAFIPCGHTFCRVCVRELWLNRGSCPLCNRAILEILDIF